MLEGWAPGDRGARDSFGESLGKRLKAKGAGAWWGAGHGGPASQGGATHFEGGTPAHSAVTAWVQASGGPGGPPGGHEPRWQPVVRDGGASETQILLS